MTPALLRDKDIPEADGQAVTIRLCTRLTDGRDDAAPVRVLPRHGGLDQGRIGDGERNLCRIFRAGCAGHPNLDQCGRAFAIADDLKRQIAHHALQRGFKGFGDRTRRLHLGRGRLARCGDQQRVRGRGVAVDGDGVECFIHIARHHLLQVRGADLGIREDVDQHRCHVGRDHARSFGNARDADLTAFALHRGRRALGECVGRHHGLRRHFDGVFAQIGH